MIHRLQPITDAAMPSGNGRAVQALWRLGQVVGNKTYLDAAERALRLFYPSMRAQPMAHVSPIRALKEYLDPPL